MRYPCRILTYSHSPAKRVYSDISVSVHAWDDARAWCSREDWDVCQIISNVYANYVDNYLREYETTYREPGHGNTHMRKSDYEDAGGPAKEHLNVRVDGYPKYWEKHH